MQVCSMQVCMYASMQVCKYANIQLSNYASVQVYKYASMKVYNNSIKYVCKWAKGLEILRPLYIRESLQMHKEGLQVAKLARMQVS